MNAKREYLTQGGDYAELIFVGAAALTVLGLGVSMIAAMAGLIQ